MTNLQEFYNGQQIWKTTGLEVITCCRCGIPFAVPNHWKESRKQDGASFCCPNGHYQSFKETEAQRLVRQLQQEREKSERYLREAASSERRRRAEKAAKTKFKKRIKGGACPCCNRTFVQLARHIKTRHPEFKA